MQTMTLTMPDIMPAIDEMSLPEISKELASYRPATRETVVSTEEWLSRRRALWRRLDALLGIRPPAVAKPVTG
jgi:hypothetical protein